MYANMQNSMHNTLNSFIKFSISSITRHIYVLKHISLSTIIIIPFESFRLGAFFSLIVCRRIDDSNDGVDR